jgi:DNA mismatch endonuclease (patch repair protein)
MTNHRKSPNTERRRTNTFGRHLERPPPPSSEFVSRVMRGNRARNTLPERLLGDSLQALGAPAHEKQRGELTGTPDIVFMKQRTAVFVNGCFWHGCPHCNLPRPKTHRTYWLKKIEVNARRDRAARHHLRQQGWNVIVVWECEIKRNPTQIGKRILGNLRQSDPPTQTNRME